MQKDLEIPDGLFISEPGEGGSLALLSGGGSTDGRPVVYVSARPGTFPDATALALRNVTTDGPVIAAIPVVEGGFDPVSLLASTGDELELTVATGDASWTLTLTLTVPPDRPPLVVRTEPPKGRTDVAFAARPLVIFSEPMDASTVTPASVQLMRDGTAVPATVALVSESPFTAQLVPDEPLQSSTTYELVVTTAVRDLQGDPLDEEVRVAFLTAPTVFEGQIFVTSGGSTWGSLRVIDSDGSTRPIDYLEDEATASAISPDGTRLLFSQRSGPSQLWVMNTDGSGLKQLIDLPAPVHGATWSPDGMRIAFSVGPELWVMDADGSDAFRLVGDLKYPRGGTSWSPDGAEIAFAASDCEACETRPFAIGVDGSNRRWLDVRGLPSDDRVDVLNATWSPDGTKIAFEVRRWAYVGGFWLYDYLGGDIWVANADGSDAVNLTAGAMRAPGSVLTSHAAERPCWSPDGSRIAFNKVLFAGTGGAHVPEDVFLMNANGYSLVALTSSPEYPDHVGSSQCWSR